MYAARQSRWVFLGLFLSAAGALAEAAPARADDTYVAIAVSKSAGKYGFASKCASREEAEQKAIQDCGEKDAKAVIWAKNGWCALAFGDGGAYCYDSGATEAEARGKAKKLCAEKGDHPRIVLVVASTGERGGADGAVIGAGTDYYAAVAYSPTTGKYGFATKCGSQEEAQKKAIKDCGDKDVKVATWARNGWVALVRADDGSYSCDFADTEAEAGAKAKKTCADVGGVHPRIVLVVASTGERRGADGAVIGAGTDDAVITVLHPRKSGGGAGEVIGAATDYYAAIAGSGNTGKIGSATKCTSREQAEKKAIQDCGADDAKVVIWCLNGWCALAKGDKAGIYGWDRGATAAEARANTLKQCEKLGFTGKVILCVSAKGETEAP